MYWRNRFSLLGKVQSFDCGILQGGDTIEIGIGVFKSSIPNCPVNSCKKPSMFPFQGDCIIFSSLVIFAVKLNGSAVRTGTVHRFVSSYRIFGTYLYITSEQTYFLGYCLLGRSYTPLWHSKIINIRNVMLFLFLHMTYLCLSFSSHFQPLTSDTRQRIPVQ